MDNTTQALRILSDTIVKAQTHTDYARTVELAKKYSDIFIGEDGLDEYIQQIAGRESDAMLAQRKKIYKSAIPAIVESITTVFQKPLRSNRVFASVEHQSAKARDEITERMRSFWQGESESGVDAYLRDRWLYLNELDPNAFIAVEFGAFDPVSGKPYPFPVEYSSEQAINYKYRNGTLDWVIFKEAWKYRTHKEKPEETGTGARYVMYLDNTAIVLEQVDTTLRIPKYEGAELLELKSQTGTIHSVYEHRQYQMKAGGVPAFRVGYKKDKKTNGRTCVSIIHPALNVLLKEIKTGSEFDLTMSLHVFPQKIMWGRRCEGDREKGTTCNNGRTINGGICPVCDGTTVMPIHTSAQDVVLIAPPKDGDIKMDLDGAFVYKHPPIELVKFQQEYQEKLAIQAKAAVFASQAAARSTITTTATEQDYSWDNVYDTLQPFAEKYSYAWRFIVGKIAVYTDNSGPALSVYHAFPRDFKMKGVSTLLAEAKQASESGLSQHAKDAFNNDILETYYADDQDTLLRIKVKNRFHPFSGKSDTEIQSLLMAGDILPYYRTLYVYFDVIFDEIDNVLGEKFYLLSYDGQKAEVRKIVDRIMAEQAQVSATTFNATRPQNDAVEQ